tara:strand:- start:993 stop:1262 length:270 start_codon:yes stop_codon:yes gene_type:complete
MSELKFDDMMAALNVVGRRADFVKKGEVLVVRKDEENQVYEYYLIDEETKDKIGTPEWSDKPICKIGQEKKLIQDIYLQILSFENLCPR